MIFSDKQRELLSRPLYGTVATLRMDGTPVLVTVWYDLDGDDLWFIAGQDSWKVRHLRRDPRISFHVVDPKGFPYVSCEGTATISIDEDYAHRLHMATRYRGPEGGKQYLEQNPIAKPPAVVRIAVARVIGMGVRRSRSF